MQRLIGRLRDEDRGATAVIVALLMVPVLAIAALAVDVAALHWDKQQLQTGADAAALAIAQDCADGTCTGAESTARVLAQLNKNDGEADGAVVELDESTGTVTVETSAIREHWFAPVIGIDETEVVTRSSARWGYPVSGTSVIPLALSVCEISAQTGISFTRDPVTGDVVGLDLTGTSDNVMIVPTKESQTSCTGQSNNYLPGGFGWLVPEERVMECRAHTAVGQDAHSDPGNNFPCNTSFDGDNLQHLLGQTVFLPIFEDAHGTGNNGRYSIIGYTAFVLTDYHFGNSYTNPVSNGLCDSRSGNKHCVAGRFTHFTDTAGRFELDPHGPRFGAAVAELTLPTP